MTSSMSPSYIPKLRTTIQLYVYDSFQIYMVRSDLVIHLSVMLELSLQSVVKGGVHVIQLLLKTRQ
jgi:hypothetical protein